LKALFVAEKLEASDENVGVEGFKTYFINYLKSMNLNISKFTYLSTPLKFKK
jgi:hypothetical protein